MHLSGSCCRIRHTWKPPRRECSTRSKISVRRVAFPKWSMGIRSTGIEDPEQWGTSEVVWGHCQEQRPRTTYSCHFNFYLEMMKKNNHQSTLEPWSDLCTNQVKKLWHQFYNNRTSSAKCFRLYPTVRKKKSEEEMASICACCKTLIWVYAKRMLSQNRLSFVLLGRGHPYMWIRWLLCNSSFS